MAQEHEVSQAEPPASPLATIKLASGQEITMYRDGEGFRLCHSEACLLLPNTTASEAMGLFEFFKGLEDKDADSC